MSMRDTLDPAPSTVPPIFDDGEHRLGIADPPARFMDPGLDGESGVSAPPDNAPTEARPPQVPAEQPEPNNFASQWSEQTPAGPTIALDEAAYATGNSCVQCGLCLPACPTYLETGNEADSPRGRIRQMLGLHDGDIPYTPAGQEHLDRCLDCRACETACPSGVVYHRLIEDARHKLKERQAATGGTLSRSERFQRWVFYNILTQPNRLRMALLPARLLQKVGIWSLFRMSGLMRLLPATLQRMERMLPSGGPLWPGPLPPHSRAGGIDMVVTMLNPAAGDVSRPRVLVGFFEGCIAAVMNATVHRKAAELMCASGADVISPPDQVCCGAIHLHNNDPDIAADLARRNIDTYLPEGGPELDWIVTCTAGDGAMLRQYGELLTDDPIYAERARRFSAKVRDISEVLVELGLPRIKQRLVGCVTYHDACHLAHAQKVTSAPRRLLGSIPGLEFVELPESDVCCGAAGTYNLTQPEMAGALARRKLDRVAETNCHHVVSGNIGCSLHLAAEAAEMGRSLKIVHPVELVHEAVFGQS